jgi:hypothetical protein
MVTADAIRFAEALRAFKVACKDIGVCPTMIGFSASTDVGKVSTALEIAHQSSPGDYLMRDIIGGREVFGIKLKRAWK